MDSDARCGVLSCCDRGRGLLWSRVTTFFPEIICSSWSRFSVLQNWRPHYVLACSHMGLMSDFPISACTLMRSACRSRCGDTSLSCFTKVAGSHVSGGSRFTVGIASIV